ncbi:PEP-CTERM system TPR-repeat protein PrsT [Dechloromonas sp. XY25]|uniref:PEP-CTERM system TPR-repeat protein PrsT n=1 Tax=Dechloromonas hankyongensis TaxID=2908002 RepID=A0ABS9K2V3_9RHOO|nr:XrtA/PEP-CTERM system TPR-repeat protein PrsT [Dechloromonas hankyongensis]MCG2577516.1 PEP-CTERM system TPR-repeat protein PrsT [Dechloromonas hankyongensis]
MAQDLGLLARASLAAAIAGCFMTPALATPEKAASYYEDALRRFEKDDMPAAVIQLKNAIQQDQKMLAAHLLLGKALLKDGDLKGAEAAFEEALKQGVNRGEVAIPLGQVFMALGRPDAVIDRIQPSGLSPALQVDILTLRGNAYLESGKNSLATQNFDQARSIDPRSATPLIAEVSMLLGMGRIDQAREKANRAVELAPNNAFAWNAKASVLHASLDAAGAMAAYDKALALTPKHVDARIARAALLIDLKREAEARKDLDYLLEQAPDEPRAAYLRAVLAGQKGDTVAVNDALKEVTRTIDAVPPAWLARREQLLMAGALAHYGLANHQKAREYLDAVIARNPGNNGAKKLLASIYVDAKDYARAQTLLESLQRALPDDPQVMYLLGSVNLAQRRYSQASELLEKAAARTGSPEINRSLGFSQLSMGKAEQGQASLERAFAANPADAQAGMALATLYIRLGKPDKALKTAEGMVKRDPANLTALNFLGALKGASGDKNGARAVYGEVLAKDPDFTPSVLNLARLDMADKRFDEARRRLDAVLRKRSDDAQVLFEYGQLEQRAGRPEEAIRYLAKAGNVQRTDPAPSLALIDLHLNLRQSDQALAVAKQLSGKFPTSLPAQLALARSFLASGDAINARSTLGGATRLAEFDAKAQAAIARLQLAANNPDGASYSVYKALQGNPEDVSALALAVQVEARRGDAAKADAALKTLLAKHPNALETLRVTADLAMSRGQYAAAIAGYRKLLSREENTGNALALVQAHIAAGEAAKATSVLEGWVKGHPKDKLASKALAEAQFRAGQLAAARQTYQSVVKESPDDALALNNYANLLQQMNDPAAQEMAERAVKLSPNSAIYADTLGWILVGKGQIEPGLRYLREARLRSPESAEIRFHLAYALSKVGRKEEAKEELSAALRDSGRLANNVPLAQLRKELGL